MSERETLDARGLMLDFVERHWRELTLRDARLLCADHLEPDPGTAPNIKETLTCA